MNRNPLARVVARISPCLAPRIVTTIVTLLVALLAPSSIVTAARAADVNGTAVCIAPGDQLGPGIAAAGAGGAIVAWQDLRPTAPSNGVCFAQRVNAAVVPQWTVNGVALTTTGDIGDPPSPAIASDGAGGAFIAQGGGTSAPRAQWVNAAGVPQWGADGVTLTNAPPTMRDLAIVRDVGGAGGAIVVWRQDNGAGALPDIYAQKVNAAGAVQWGPGGVAVTFTNSNSETLPALITDGAGGAILTWFIGTGGCRAQRLDASGATQWSNTSLSGVSNNRRPAIVPDGSGGAVIGWAAGNTGIFVQRVSAIGSKQWSPANTGVQLSTSGNQCAMIPDGAGGAMVAWQDFRTGTNYNIYAQRVNGTGTPQWIVNGVPVSFVQGDQVAPTMVTDGGTGAIITWQDGRSFANGDDIYAQRIDATGASLWTPDGLGICTVTGAQQLPTIAADGAGGAFVAWQDRRSGTSEDVYVHHLGPAGEVLAVPGVDVAPSAVRAWPNPFLDRVQLGFALPAAASMRLEVLDVRGRVVRAYEPGAPVAGEQVLGWDGRVSDGRPAGPGIYFLRATGPGIALTRAVVRLE